MKKLILAALLSLIPSLAFADNCLVNSGVAAYSSGQVAQQNCDTTGATKVSGTVQQSDGIVGTASASSAAPLLGTGTDATTGAIDMTGYESISFQHTTIGGANTVTYEVSNDNVNWASVSGYAVNNTGVAVAAVSDTSPTLTLTRQFNITTKYIRARTSTYASGTNTVIYNKKVTPVAPISVFVAQGTSNPLNQWGISANAQTGSGGIAIASRIPSSAATTNATSAKATGGRLFKITGYNASATVKYLKFYNKASAPTVGTDPVVSFKPLPPGAFSYDWSDIGFYFATGIAYAITGLPADADTTAIAAGDILALSVEYQ